MSLISWWRDLFQYDPAERDEYPPWHRSVYDERMSLRSVQPARVVRALSHRVVKAVTPPKMLHKSVLMTEKEITREIKRDRMLAESQPRPSPEQIKAEIERRYPGALAELDHQYPHLQTWPAQEVAGQTP